MLAWPKMVVTRSTNGFSWLLIEGSVVGTMETGSAEPQLQQPGKSKDDDRDNIAKARGQDVRGEEGKSGRQWGGVHDWVHVPGAGRRAWWLRRHRYGGGAAY